MKFSQLNARVRKKRKGKQILRVLPALLFSLPRYITFEIPVRRAESTKRGGSRLVRIQRAIFCLPSPPLVYPLFSLFARLYVRASSVSTRSTARSLDILETRISLPCIECPWKIETNPVFFLFLSLILGKRGSSFFLLFIPFFLPFFFFKIWSKLIISLMEKMKRQKSCWGNARRSKEEQSGEARSRGIGKLEVPRSL